jgi:type I restriction enzyme, S subunit
VSELPAGWIETTINEVTSTTAQRQPQQDESFIYIDIGSIDREKKSISNPQRLEGKDAPSRARKVVRTGDVLVSTTRPNLNAVAMISDEFDNQIASTGFDVLRASGLDTRWLFYLVRTTEFIEVMSELVQGALYPAVRPKDIRAFQIPLAPLAEQKRIADKLDRLLARVDACRERCDRIPLILKRFRQAVLAAATSGELTEDWREKQKLDKPNLINLSSIVSNLKTEPFGSALHKSDYIRDGIPVVNPMHINAGNITPSTDMTISEEKAEELREYRFQQGDIVFARRGVMGRCAVIGSKEKGWLCGSGSMIIHMNDLVLPGYLQMALSSPTTVAALEDNAVGSTMVNLNQKILLELEIVVPPLPEQHEIVRRVETLFAFADRLEARYKTARAQVERLTPALLDKAFQGELVPQDPNDEPASALLERIQAARASTAAKLGKTQRPKAASSKSHRIEVIMLNRKDIQPTHLANILKTSGSLTAEALWTASQLTIDDFYDQLKAEEAQGLLRETRSEAANAPRLLEVA